MMSMVLCSQLRAPPERSESHLKLFRMKNLMELGYIVGQKMVGLG